MRRIFACAMYIGVQIAHNIAAGDMQTVRSNEMQ